jgi:hypothetical protein
MDRIGLHLDNQLLEAEVAFESASAADHIQLGTAVVAVGAELDILYTDYWAAFVGQGTLSVDTVKCSLWVGAAFAFGHERSLGT